MFSTSWGKVCLWGISNNTRGRVLRIPLTPGVLSCKTISNNYSLSPRGGPSKQNEAVRENPSVVKKVADSIAGKLHRWRSRSKLHIHKVPKGPCNVNVEAYTTPMLVSIGPYHHENSKLHAMNEHKQRYLHSFLDRKTDNSLESYISALKELEEKARQCYTEPIGLDSHDFVEMMLLDGCFIIEFVRRGYSKHARGEDIDDPIFNEDGMEYQIRRDIMLLENQLPHFVLSKLYNMNKLPEEEEEGPFKEMAMPFFTGMLSKPRPLAIK